MKFQAFYNAQPVHGCPRPSCMDWTSGGYPTESQTSSYRTKRQTEVPGSANEFPELAMLAQKIQNGHVIVDSVAVNSNAAINTANTVPAGQEPVQGFEPSRAQVPPGQQPVQSFGMPTMQIPQAQQPFQGFGMPTMQIPQAQQPFQSFDTPTAQVSPAQQPFQDFGMSVPQAPQNVMNVPPAPYAYPSCPSGMNSGYFCFSADTLVQLASGKVKRMDELSIDDWVLSATDKEIGYSIVESWIHRMPEVNAEFIRFTLEDGKVLKITNKHFLYRGDCSNARNHTDFNRASSDMVYAEEIKDSDCLFVHDNNKFIETRITQIDYVKEKGIYAPMTSSTNIIVNGIHSSCFNIIRNKQVQNTFSHSLQQWASSLIGKFFKEKSEEANEIELVPGMQNMVQILTHIVPSKF